MAFSGHKLDGSKNYKNLLQEHETKSCRQTESCRWVTMNRVTNAKFRSAKISQVAKISQPGKFLGKIVLPFPALEPLQQHKTKNYEKISL